MYKLALSDSGNWLLSPLLLIITSIALHGDELIKSFGRGKFERKRWQVVG